jgi:hypothetical protein
VAGRLIFAGRWSTRPGMPMFWTGAPCAEQDNFLAYWSYCLTDDSFQTALTRQSMKNLLKLLCIGSMTGGGLPEESLKYYGTDVRQITEYLLKCRELALKELTRQGMDKLVLASFPSMVPKKSTIA